jgi:regulator of nucleoside diphosphate kinase
MFRDMQRIYIQSASHLHLKSIVNEAYNASEQHAPLLDAELRRAIICEKLPKHVVTPGSIVRYQIDWGAFTPARRLVYPLNFTSEAEQISLLSPIGIALLGMRRGDTIQIRVADDSFQTLHVATVVYPESEWFEATPRTLQS